MKKIICGLLFILACGATFTACSDDDDDLQKHATAPETASAGTYSGTWTKAQIGATTEHATGEGTMVLAAAVDENGNQIPYATTVTVKSESLKLDKTSIANVAWSNDNMSFSSQVLSNGFGTKFSGRVLADGSASISFTITEKQGRKTFNYLYTFKGNKQ